MNYFDIIRQDFPLVFKEIDPDNILTDTEGWFQMKQIIKESQSYHVGMDMSGLISLFSLIKKDNYDKTTAKSTYIMCFYCVYSESFAKYEKKKKKKLLT